jgi:hypothetical protein
LQYLVDLLFEVGPTEQGGLGPSPISWQELRAWNELMSRNLQPWELVMIRRLSVEYVGFGHEAQSSDCPAPWSDEPTVDERVAAGERLRMMLRGKRAQ